MFVFRSFVFTLWPLLGDDFYKKQNYDEAIKKYSEAIKLDKTQAVFFSNRSACYLEIKQYSKASADGKKSIELNGRFVKGYYRYARAQKFLGDHVEAVKYARHGLSIDPSSADLRHLLVQELGVSESDLPADPNKDAQPQQPVIPVVAGVAVTSAGEAQQQQHVTVQDQSQPMMVQGQPQPMMVQGQQPMMMQGQPQPMMMQGQPQPMMVQGQQPMMMQGQSQPMMMQGQPQPMMMQGQQPMMMQGQSQPMMMQGQPQPMMMQGQQPMVYFLYTSMYAVFTILLSHRSHSTSHIWILR